MELDTEIGRVVLVRDGTEEPVDWQYWQMVEPEVLDAKTNRFVLNSMELWAQEHR